MVAITDYGMYHQKGPLRVVQRSIPKLGYRSHHFKDTDMIILRQGAPGSPVLFFCNAALCNLTIRCFTKEKIKIAGEYSPAYYVMRDIKSGHHADRG